VRQPIFKSDGDFAVGLKREPVKVPFSYATISLSHCLPSILDVYAGILCVLVDLLPPKVVDGCRRARVAVGRAPNAAGSGIVGFYALSKPLLEIRQAVESIVIGIEPLELHAIDHGRVLQREQCRAGRR